MPRPAAKSSQIPTGKKPPMTTAIKSTLLAFGLFAQGTILPGPGHASGLLALDDTAAILAKLTLEQKIDLMGQRFRQGFPEMGIRAIDLADGPMGFNRNTGRANPAYPATQLLAATFNRDLAAAFADSLATDFLINGADVLLAPGMNVQRVPVNGRNPEYFGEDPYLISQMVVPVIRGVQRHGLMATAKHFVANNQDYNRYKSNSIVAERTLREIYFPGFKAAVEAGVGGVMAGHNRFNGMHCVESEFLGRVLRDEWDFEGIYISDWNGRHDVEKSFRAELDVDAPMGRMLNRDSLKPMIEREPALEAHLDDKVRRILWARERFQVSPDNPLARLSPDREQSRRVALDIAREGIVLLKNKDGALPLEKESTLALVGPRAAPFEYSHSGSASVARTLPVAELAEALEERGATVLLSPHGFMDELCMQSVYAEPVQVELFGNETCVGEPLKRWETERIFIKTGHDLPVEVSNPYGSEHLGSKIVVDGRDLQNFSMRFKTVLIPTKSGEYLFATASCEGMWVSLDGREIINGETMGHVTNHHAVVPLEAGRRYELEVRHRRRMRAYEARFGYGQKEEVLENLVGARLAAEADAAIVAVGYGRDFEGEDSDRSFELPDFQSWFIQEVASRARKTVVVAFAGGAFETASWLDQVEALLWVSYPGWRGATAIAEILFGDVNPSGKLPFTFDADFTENPAYPFYAQKPHDMEYGEGIFVGYRGYDAAAKKPLYPFGHGLSYSAFAYRAMRVRREGEKVVVSIDVQNTGKGPGKETVLVFVEDVDASVARPPRELKGFEKFELDGGETATVEIRLDSSAFSFFHPEKREWVVEPGDFVLRAGASAGDLPLQERFSMDNE